MNKSRILSFKALCVVVNILFVCETWQSGWKKLVSESGEGETRKLWISFNSLPHSLHLIRTKTYRFFSWKDSRKHLGLWKNSTVFKGHQWFSSTIEFNDFMIFFKSFPNDILQTVQKCFWNVLCLYYWAFSMYTGQCRLAETHAKGIIQKARATVMNILA